MAAQHGLIALSTVTGVSVQGHSEGRVEQPVQFHQGQKAED